MMLLGSILQLPRVRQRARSISAREKTIRPLGNLAEAIGQAVDVPARGLPRTEVEALWGAFLTGFVDYDNRASSAKAQRELGWRPQAKYGLLADITTGSYSELARQLRLCGVPAR
jgi:nucleoside-diphosphate-sugar epimerase